MCGYTFDLVEALGLGLKLAEARTVGETNLKVLLASVQVCSDVEGEVFVHFVFVLNQCNLFYCVSVVGYLPCLSPPLLCVMSFLLSGGRYY